MTCLSALRPNPVVWRATTRRARFRVARFKPLFVSCCLANWPSMPSLKAPRPSRSTMPNKQRDPVFYSKEAKNFSKKNIQKPGCFHSHHTHIKNKKRKRNQEMLYRLIFLFVLISHDLSLTARSFKCHYPNEPEMKKNIQ
jgi:hypothetical protein